MKNRSIVDPRYRRACRPQTIRLFANSEAFDSRTTSLGNFTCGIAIKNMGADKADQSGEISISYEEVIRILIENSDNQQAKKPFLVKNGIKIIL